MKEFFKVLFTVLRQIGAILTGFRNLVINGLFLLILAIFMLSLISVDTKVVLPKKAALIVTIAGDVVEEKQQSEAISEFLHETWGISQKPSETALQDILDAIDKARDDERITCILLNLEDMGRVSLSQLQTIGKALTEFRKSGKEIIAAEDYYSQKAYYLASHSSKLFLNPMGGVDLHGFGIFRLYFKEALDKLKITYNTFRVGTHKSALEPIMRNSMSREAREQNLSLLTTLWDQYLDGVMTNRSLKRETLTSYTNDIAAELATTDGDTALLAMKTGLVDALKTRPEIRKYMQKIVGKPRNRDTDFTKIEMADYLKDVGRSYIRGQYNLNQVGIIVAQGTILHGRHSAGRIGDLSMAEMIRKATKNRKIKALVLRIDSGGGSVFASEAIRQELLTFKKSGKPLVISMAGMAASGGYWIAADADEIWAEPTTITGSIGIFGAIPTFERTIGDYGFHSDGVGTTPLSSGLNITRPMPPLLKETIQQSVAHGYETFLDIVAKGRGLSRADLDKVAQGRIWSGITARELGLVDNLGSLADAVAAAGKLAKMETYSGRYIHPPRTFGQEFLSMLKGKALTRLVALSLPEEWVTVMASLLQPIQEAIACYDPRGLYAHCLFTID